MTDPNDLTPMAAPRRLLTAPAPADPFTERIEQELDTLYTFCVRVAGDHARGYDLAHDALTRAMTKREHYDPDLPLRPWLLTIARNTWASRMRSPMYRATEFWMNIGEAPSAEPHPDQSTLQIEADRCVRHALRTLRPDYREAVSLFHLEGMSYAEMAQITGASADLLRQRVKRGRMMLREKLTKLYPDTFGDRRV